jgi:hypothetical protein
MTLPRETGRSAPMGSQKLHLAADAASAAETSEVRRRKSTLRTRRAPFLRYARYIMSCQAHSQLTKRICVSELWDFAWFGLLNATERTVFLWIDRSQTGRSARV